MLPDWYAKKISLPFRLDEDVHRRVGTGKHVDVWDTLRARVSEPLSDGIGALSGEVRERLAGGNRYRNGDASSDGRVEESAVGRPAARALPEADGSRRPTSERQRNRFRPVRGRT